MKLASKHAYIQIRQKMNSFRKGDETIWVENEFL